MSEMKQSIDDVMEMMGDLSKHQPESLRHFKAYMGEVLKEGVLDTKTKELIAVGTAITARCKYCIALHVKTALDSGVSKDEIF